MPLPVIERSFGVVKISGLACASNNKSEILGVYGRKLRFNSCGGWLLESFDTLGQRICPNDRTWRAMRPGLA